MADPTAEIDRLEARVKDVLGQLGLEKCGLLMLDPGWLDHISGTEAWTFLLRGATASLAAGHLWIIAAQDTIDGESVAAFMVEARPAQS